MIIGIPIGIASFMGFLTDDRSKRTELPKISVALCDLDDSPLSRRVLAGFQRDPQFNVTITNVERARAWVQSGKSPGALILPHGFGDDLLPGLFDTNRKPEVTLLFDPSHSVEKSVLEGFLVPKLIAAAVEEIREPETAKRLLKAGMDRLELASGLAEEDRLRIRRLLERTEEWVATRTNGPAGASAATAGTSSSTFAIPSLVKIKAEPATVRQRRYNGYAHAFAGMGLQFILMGMVDFAVNLLKDRQTGIFQRLRSAPLPRQLLLMGKLLAQSLIALISLGSCFAFAMVVFGVRIEGSLIGFGLLLAVVPPMAASFGLFLAALGGTPAGTRGLSIALVLLMVMVGGAWFPSFLFPSWLQTVGMATPTRWVLDGFDAVTWRGLGLEAVLPSIAALIGFTALFTSIGFARFRWQSGQ